MHRAGVHVPSYDAPDPWDCRDKIQIKWMLSEALPQCTWRWVARPALKPRPRGGHPDCGGILHPCFWFVHLIRREHDVRASLLRAACCLPSEHYRLVNVLMEAGAGLCHPSLWSGFCRIRSCLCSVLTLDNGPNGQDVQIRIWTLDTKESSAWQRNWQIWILGWHEANGDHSDIHSILYNIQMMLGSRLWWVV